VNEIASIATEETLEDRLSRPSAALRRDIAQWRSPLLVLGASGKMGPSLCRLAQRAATEGGTPLQIIAASRFSDPRKRSWLESHQVHTIACYLLERRSLESLPDTENVIYLVGLKFGTRQNPGMTWAVNTLVPAWVAERYPTARIVALSTGNVYRFVSTASNGATEDLSPDPVGEYGYAALARERVFEFYSRKQGTRIVLLRLNYAVELRYGVLLDLAERIWRGDPIDLAAGHLNCIWQGDANEMILRSLFLAATPPAIYNLTGPGVLRVRELAERLGAIMERAPSFVGTESTTGLLNNPARLCARLGLPSTSLDRILEWTAQWVMKGGVTLGKPTHFEVRDGAY